METGEALKEARLGAKLTQKQLGVLANMDKGWISLIETGKRKPNNETLSKLAKVLGVPPESLAFPKGSK